MSAIDELFENLKSKDQTAFMPFVTAGDSDLGFTAKLIKSLDSSGCHLIELGFPYSDPIADGPVIQASYTRALENGVTVSGIFETVAGLKSHINTPIVAMVSYAIIYRHGIESFVEQAVKSGIAGAIVPDLPVDESESLREVCERLDFDLIQLITPTTSESRVAEIAKHARGFIYYVSIAGITGERTELPTNLVERLTWLRQQTNTPICVGFGISNPDQAKMLSTVADGVIVGSAIVRRIADGDKDSALQSISEFSQAMLSKLND